MLLDNEYTIIPSIKFTLTYSDGTRKVITVKTRDKIDCSYKKNGEITSIVGIVTKIGCNFNSSLGTVGTTAYLQVDGSSEYAGQVEYIQPNQVLCLSILSTSDVIDNVVCSVDNEDQRISLIRENEVGVMQYSLDGINWRPVTGGQGMSAYESAVKLGFEGSEKEWLESLKGEDGKPGEAGALEVFKVYKTSKEAIDDKNNVPQGKLITITNEDIPYTNPQLFVRDYDYDNINNCNCPDCNCKKDDKYITGYRYIGDMTVGPIGPMGKDGKSAYETAVEGGFPGTEEEFVSNLANVAVPVTNNYVGPIPILKNTIVGPIDLRLYGFTNSSFISKQIKKIDISSPMESYDQSIIFNNPVVLRAIPTEHESAKPNIIINGKKYVSDCIMNNAGKVGVLRRIGYIDNYNGETIISDWMSSTGELDLGAQVQFVIPGNFEPFEEKLQEQYRKLHTFNGETVITTNDSVYVSVSYPIELVSYVEHLTTNKQDKLIAGDNIVINSNTISTPGAIFEEEFVTTMDVGGLDKGYKIRKGDKISDILEKILSPYVKPEDRCIYWGGTKSIPNNLDGLNRVIMDDEVLLQGVTYSYTLDDSYPVFAYKKVNGLLKSIKDGSGFENINGWSYAEYSDYKSGNDFYIYYSDEPLTINNYPFTFTFK